MLNMILLVCACIVLHRVVVLSSRLKRSAFGFQRIRFALLSCSVALCSAGAFAVATGLNWGGAVLLLGVAGKITFDRRAAREGIAS